MTDRELSALFHKHSEYWLKRSDESENQVTRNSCLIVSLAFKKLHEDLMK